MSTTTLGQLWDSTRMRLLVEIERLGSLSAAAQAIGIGQPSASRHLRLLEAAAGQRLVERNGRGSRLTEAGRVLAARAAQALASLDAADEELAALSGLETGTIRLGASTAPGVYLLPHALGCFRRDHPGITIDVEIAASGEILRRLLAGRIQLALVGAQTADERIELEPLVEDEIVGIAKPGTVPLRKGCLDPQRIASLLLLCREPESSSRQLVEQELQAIGIQPAGTWSSAPARLRSGPRARASASRFSPAAPSPRRSTAATWSFRLAGRPPLRRHFSIARLAGRPLSRPSGASSRPWLVVATRLNGTPTGLSGASQVRGAGWFPTPRRDAHSPSSRHPEHWPPRSSSRQRAPAAAGRFMLHRC